jgi:hypothetical protein
LGRLFVAVPTTAGPVPLTMPRSPMKTAPHSKRSYEPRPLESGGVTPLQPAP